MRASIGRTAGYAADISAGAINVATAGTFKEGYVVAFLLRLTEKTTTFHTGKYYILWFGISVSEFIRVFAPVFKRVFRGRKIGLRYFKIGQTYFEICALYFFFSPKGV